MCQVMSVLFMVDFYFAALGQQNICLHGNAGCGSFCGFSPPPPLFFVLFCFLPLKGTHLKYQTKAFSACGLGTFVSQCLHSALLREFSL